MFYVFTFMYQNSLVCGILLPRLQALDYLSARQSCDIPMRIREFVRFIKSLGNGKLMYINVPKRESFSRGGSSITILLDFLTHTVTDITTQVQTLL